LDDEIADGRLFEIIYVLLNKERVTAKELAYCDHITYCFVYKEMQG